MVKAYNDEGIDVHFYFSVMDWSHLDWRYDVKTPEDSAAFSRFLTFTDNQLKELATLYPTVKDFWFDGTWDASIKKNGWWTAHVERMLKEMLPGVTINSRLRADDYGKRHFDSNGHLMGDYESGYERRLPDPVKDLKVTRWDWEACMTVPETNGDTIKTGLSVMSRLRWRCSNVSFMPCPWVAIWLSTSVLRRMGISVRKKRNWLNPSVLG